MLGVPAAWGSQASARVWPLLKVGRESSATLQTYMYSVHRRINTESGTRVVREVGRQDGFFQLRSKEQIKLCKAYIITIQHLKWAHCCRHFDLS